MSVNHLQEIIEKLKNQLVAERERFQRTLDQREHKLRQVSTNLSIKSQALVKLESDLSDHIQKSREMTLKYSDLQ